MNRRTISLADINPKCLERNMAALRPPERRAKSEEAAEMARDIIKVKQPRQMTRTEREFEAILKRECPAQKIVWEWYRLRIGEKCWYTPDFALIFTWPEEDGSCGSAIHFFEVKGAYLFKGAHKSATTASLTKPKAAATLYPQHRFFVAQKNKDGTWSREEYLPA